MQTNEATPTDKSISSLIKSTLWAVTNSMQLKKGVVTWYFISSLVTQIESIVSISLYGYLISSITTIVLTDEHHSLTELIYPFSMYALVTLAFSVVRNAGSDYISRAKEYADIQLKKAFLTHLLTLSEKEIEKVYAQEDISTAYADTSKIYAQFQHAINILVSLSVAFLVSVYLGTFSLILPIILVLVSLVYFAGDRYYRKRNTASVKNAKYLLSRVQSANKYFLSAEGRNILRNNGATDTVYSGFQPPFEQYNTSLSMAKRSWVRFSRLSASIGSLISILVLSVVLYYQPALIQIGSIYVLLRLVTLLKSKFDSVFLSINSLEDTSLEIKKLLSFYSTAPTNKDYKVPTTGQEPSVELQNISFSQNNTVIVGNLTLALPTQTSLTIYAGNPKDTPFLYSILTGLQQPTTGAVFIDNVPITEVSPSDKRTQYAFLSASQIIPFLSLQDHVSIQEKFSFSFEHFTPYLQLLGLTPLAEKPELLKKTITELKKEKLISNFGILSFLIAKDLYHQKKLVIINLSSFGLTREQEQSIVDRLEKVRTHLGLTLILLTSYITSATKTEYVGYFLKGVFQEFGKPSELLAREEGIMGKLYKTTMAKLAELAAAKKPPQ